ncbi:3-hydroxyisobutyryl-CoA hydrolase-like protein 1, mitochondrial [Vitis vinifera]|uniref:3-hydroxyisobutyryl-CoA hydrolase n=1 Tax=Vitis vinifera TaxID=29760 RepID=A0A438BW41_VITVI|nr:3-hydroxyisobutyryl-CoA hydrolase-like protein 1, mitochondrial [Vitis vinifera]
MNRPRQKRRHAHHLVADYESLSSLYRGDKGDTFFTQLMWMATCHSSVYKEVFATPETLIGFHTDAGASFHLSHLPGVLFGRKEKEKKEKEKKEKRKDFWTVLYSPYPREYLALTGEKLNGPEMIACGLATHYAPSAITVAYFRGEFKLLLSCCLFISTSLKHWIETLDKCFSHGTVEEIIDALRSSALASFKSSSKAEVSVTFENACANVPTRSVSFHPIPSFLGLPREHLSTSSLTTSTVAGVQVELVLVLVLVRLQEPVESETARTQDPWCSSTLKRLKEASPLSLKIREGRFQTLDQCLVREYRMSVQGISGQISNDFCEGIRARMVEKDYAPKWNPPSLEEVSSDMVDQYFSPISELEPELELPTTLREAFT